MPKTVAFPAPARPKPPAPQPPVGVSAKAQAWWSQVQSDYSIEDSAGLMLLGLAAQCVSRIEEARGIVAKEGMRVTDRFGVPRPHPMLAVEHDARSQLLLTLKQLNLDIEPLQPRPGRPGGR